MGVQLLAISPPSRFAALGTLGILTLIQATIGARADVPEESAGLDLSQHGEEAYFGADLGQRGRHGRFARRQRGRRKLLPWS